MKHKVLRKRFPLRALVPAVLAVATLALACEEEEEVATPTPTPVVLTSADFARDGQFKVGVTRMTFIDPSRPIMPSGDFSGTPDRRIDTVIWYPADTTEEGVVSDAPVLTEAWPFPLLISSHGLSAPPDSQSFLTIHLASHGYVVAAPCFPLTCQASFTGVLLERKDVENQPGDVSFVIDSMLALNAGGPAPGAEAGTAPDFRGAIDPDRIGAFGLSLGAITTYNVTFGDGWPDERIKASVSMAGADPERVASVSVPVLFFGGSRDLLLPFDTNSPPAFEQALPPKFAAKIIGGTHVWFTDFTEMFQEFANPDIGACEAVGWECVEEEQAPLIDPQRQHELVKIVVTAFFKAFLKGDAAALRFLRQRVQEENKADLEFMFAE